MIKLLGQAAELGQLGNKAIDAASQYGGEVWLLSIVLIAIGILAGVWLWQVSIPNQRANRENNSKLTEAVSTMSAIVGNTHERVMTTGQHVVEVKAAVNAICKAKAVECDILGQLADKADLDLSSQLGHLRGLSEASSDMVGK